MLSNPWLLRVIAIFALLCLNTGASASSKESSSGSAATVTTPLDPITVNLASFDRYLQISITLQVAKPEVIERVKAVMPMVRHNLIMLLSAKESAQIQTPTGKTELIDEIKSRLNNSVLEVKEHDGVTDIFFVNFVIQ